MAENLEDMLNQNGFKACLVADVDFTAEQAEENDLVISFGGDNTYLKVHSMVQNPFKTAFLAINSMPHLQKTNLGDLKLDFADHKK